MAEDFAVAVVDMLDAIGASAASIPAGTKRVAIYLTGSGGVAWTNQDVARLRKDDPELQVVYRIVQANNAGDTYLSVSTLIVDIEPGAASLPVAIQIGHARAQHGLRTTLYYFKAEEDAVHNGVGSIEGLGDVIDYWLADWNLSRSEAVALLGHNHYVAVQYASPSSNPDTLVPGSDRTLKQANVDLSVTLQDWPAPLPAPKPKPEPDAKSHGTFAARVELTENLVWSAHGRPSPGVVLGGEDQWDEAKIAVNRKRGLWRVGPLPLQKKLSAVQLHPKVIASGTIGAVLTAVAEILTLNGVHVPAGEVAAVTTILSAIAGYLTPSGGKV